MRDTATAIKKKSHHRPTRIAVEMADDRARVSTLDQGHFLGGRIMQTSGSHILLALVSIHMPLLGGDNLNIQIRVGAGVTLEVVEPSGMVAYDADGEYASWNLDVKVETGATLIWHGKEFVAAKGSNAHRRTKIELAHSARALIRETLVLGRSREPNARLNSKTTASLNGRELLKEELDLASETRQLPGIIGSSKVISTVTMLGMRPGDEAAGVQRLDLAGPGALWRSLAPAAHSAEKAVDPVFDHWYNEVLERTESTDTDTLAHHQSHVNSLI